ncbi:MAG: DUF502 domain-containing protein [Betaproteobacteria bacterium]|jgi:uncharacterized membrane protein
MHFKKYIIAGLLVWLPLAITVWILLWLVGLFDAVFAAFLSGLGTLLSTESENSLQFLREVHGLGVVLVFAVLILTGAFVSNVVGRWWMRQWDKLINLIPIVKSIYTSVKKVSNTLFSSNGNAFRKTVLIEYPHSGSWTIAFQTGAPSGEVASLLGEGMICVYVPTTPNPTSGFFLMVHQNDVKALSLSVDQALTYVLSMGAVAPDEVVNAKEIEKISPLGK